MQHTQATHNHIQHNTQTRSQHTTRTQHTAQNTTHTQHTHTTQHNTTQHNTTQHNTAQHSTAQHNTTQHNTTHTHTQHTHTRCTHAQDTTRTHTRTKQNTHHTTQHTHMQHTHTILGMAVAGKPSVGSTAWSIPDLPRQLRVCRPEEKPFRRGDASGGGIGDSINSYRICQNIGNHSSLNMCLFWDILIHLFKKVLFFPCWFSAKAAERSSSAHFGCGSYIMETC